MFYNVILNYVKTRWNAIIRKQTLKKTNHCPPPWALSSSIQKSPKDSGWPSGVQENLPSKCLWVPYSCCHFWAFVPGGPSALPVVRANVRGQPPPAPLQELPDCRPQPPGNKNPCFSLGREGARDLWTVDCAHAFFFPHRKRKFLLDNSSKANSSSQTLAPIPTFWF